MKAAQFIPRLLPSPAAAHYLGVSETTLRSLNLPRKVLCAKRLYDINMLDDFASSLPDDGVVDEGQAGCDRAFGCST